MKNHQIKDLKNIGPATCLPLVFVVGGVRRTVRGQRQRLNVVAHVRRVAASALRVQKRYDRVPFRVHVTPCNRRR
ncbi:Uncharacterized protein FWK35_00000884 [Aphis craccivora]|uniref:Uncharacterized protein n=1 Tax=Aphis craccivora TaxID=307492 RepID=A0A6G0ZS38_APHCR|nr:Uncharacterized protein FWK35_00000884 [Aphis craccivora]